VIVSACHKRRLSHPGHAPAQRVVLTAAAASRASFGCGAGDQYTYYTSALLQTVSTAPGPGASWPRRRVVRGESSSAAWREAALAAADLVGAAVTDLRIPVVFLPFVLRGEVPAQRAEGS